MSAFVVDASIGVKWVVPEVHSEAAARLLAPGNDLLVPDFFAVETANILWKKQRGGDISAHDVPILHTRLVTSGLAWFADLPLTERALAIALAQERTVYDCLYLALAEREGCAMVTADLRLFNALAGTPYRHLVRWVEDVP